MGNFVACGGFAWRPIRFQVFNHAAVGVPSRLPCVYTRQRRSALHFASPFAKHHPPICFGRCNVDNSTRKTFPPYVQCNRCCQLLDACAWYRQVLRSIPEFGQQIGGDIASGLAGKGPERMLSLAAFAPSMLIALRCRSSFVQPCIRTWRVRWSQRDCKRSLRRSLAYTSSLQRGTLICDCWFGRQKPVRTGGWIHL